MGQFLEINIIPLKLNLDISHLDLQYTRGSAQMMVSRQKGGLTMKKKFAKLNIDTFEARSSIRPTVIQSVEQYAEKGRQVAANAAAKYVAFGKRCMESQIGEEQITQMVLEDQYQHIKTNIGLDFIPKAPAKLEYIPGELDMNYEADRLAFDWKIQNPHFDYTPGDVNISVAQYPDVQIKYVADPIYVPPSANAQH